jgi:hypothetical protein
MGQDIKDLWKTEQLHIKKELTDGHEARFLDRLDKALPETEKQPKKRSFSLYQIAAAVVIIISLSGLAYQQLKQKPIVSNETVVKNDTESSDEKVVSLGDISPDLKKIEDYYVANINYELTQVDVSEIGKQLFASYMEKLSLLNEEQKVLQQELNEIGPNQQTINAMIDNLQFRLKLLYQLKEKLNELKKSENDA